MNQRPNDTIPHQQETEAVIDQRLAAQNEVTEVAIFPLDNWVVADPPIKARRVGDMVFLSGCMTKPAGVAFDDYGDGVPFIIPVGFRPQQYTQWLALGWTPTATKFVPVIINPADGSLSYDAAISNEGFFPTADACTLCVDGISYVGSI